MLLWVSDENFSKVLFIIFQAQRELQKLKYVVKLQSAVRGHLVRSQAIGTLRCVQAIAKMQTLVRARRAHQFQLLQKCTEQGKVDEEFHNNLVNTIFIWLPPVNYFYAIEFSFRYSFYLCTCSLHLGSRHKFIQSSRW